MCRRGFVSRILTHSLTGAEEVGELDDGDDGCVGEHYGVGGFDHLPEDDFLYGEGDGF